MPRAKTGVVRRRRHKKILKEAKGFRGLRSKLMRKARETLYNAAEHSFADRRKRKREYRRLWISRINAATRQHGMKYSEFTFGLRQAGIELDRKVMADLAVREPEAFARLVEMVRG